MFNRYGPCWNKMFWLCLSSGRYLLCFLIVIRIITLWFIILDISQSYCHIIMRCSIFSAWFKFSLFIETLWYPYYFCYFFLNILKLWPNYVFSLKNRWFIRVHVILCKEPNMLSYLVYGLFSYPEYIWWSGSKKQWGRMVPLKASSLLINSVRKYKSLWLSELFIYPSPKNGLIQL